MAFEDVTFPYVPTIHDQTRNVNDPVAVSTNGTYEYRVRRQRWEQFVWKIPSQTMTTEQKEAVRTFLSQRGASLTSFKFIDPELSTFTDAVMVHNSGDDWNLAIPYDATTGGVHPMFNPDIGVLTVTVDGAPGTIASFNLIDGVPTIQVTGTSGGEVVKVTGQIPFTVRLGSNFQESLYALCQDNTPRGHVVQAITLVEVYGEV